MGARVELSGSFKDAGRKILAAEKRRWETAAQHVESTVRCSEHGESPATDLVDTSRGWSLKIGACCEEAVERARAAFESEISRLRG